MNTATTPSASVSLATLQRPGTTDYHITDKHKFDTINQLVKKHCKLYRTHKFKYMYKHETL